MALVALVAVLMWLGLTGKFIQVNISAPLTTPTPIMLWPAMIPTLRLALRPYLSPTKFLTQNPLLQITVDDAKERDKFGTSVLVSKFWAILGSHSSDHAKGRAYLY